MQNNEYIIIKYIKHHAGEMPCPEREKVRRSEEAIASVQIILIIPKILTQISNYYTSDLYISYGNTYCIHQIYRSEIRNQREAESKTLHKSISIIIITYL